MKFLNAFILTALIFSATVLSADNETRAYPCYKLKSAPVLDGNISSDPAWQEIPDAGEFVRAGVRKGTLSSYKTNFKIAWLENKLFIGIICKEPAMNEIIVGDKDWQSIWLQDSIEIFIKSAEDKSYFQFLVNPKGKRASYYKKGNKVDLDKWAGTAFCGNILWSVEVMIPFELVKLNPGCRWTGNICRNIYTARPSDFITWAYVKDTAHAPELFANFTIEKEMCSRKQAEKAEKKMEAEFHTRMTLVYSKLIKEKIEKFSNLYSENLKSINSKSPGIASEILENYSALQKEFENIANIPVEKQEGIYQKAVLLNKSAFSFICHQEKTADEEKGMAIMKKLLIEKE